MRHLCLQNDFKATENHPFSIKTSDLHLLASVDLPSFFKCRYRVSDLSGHIIHPNMDGPHASWYCTAIGKDVTSPFFTSSPQDSTYLQCTCFLQNLCYDFSMFQKTHLYWLLAQQQQLCSA